MLDIVLPQGNEHEFTTLAQKLGFSELCFLYSIEQFRELGDQQRTTTNESFQIISPNKKNKEEKGSEDNGTKIKIHYGILADPRKVLRDPAKYAKLNALIAIKSSEHDRAIIENDACDIIFGIENDSRKDFLHHRASGFNHILAKQTADNKLTYCFSVSDIIRARNQHLLLGRMMQNIGICKKYKVKTFIGSFALSPLEMRSFHDMKSLFKLMGLPLKNISVNNLFSN